MSHTTRRKPSAKNKRAFFDLKTARKIVVWPGLGMGDALVTTPLFKLIKIQNPKIKTYFVIDNRYLDLVSNNPFIDEYVTVRSIHRTDSYRENAWFHDEMWKLLQKKMRQTDEKIIFLFQSLPYANIHSKLIKQSYKNSLVVTGNIRGYDKKPSRYVDFVNDKNKPSYIGITNGLNLLNYLIGKKTHVDKKELGPVINKNLFKKYSVVNLKRKLTKTGMKKFNKIYFINFLSSSSKKMLETDRAVRLLKNISKKNKGYCLILNYINSNTPLRGGKQVTTVSYIKKLLEIVKVNNVFLTPDISPHELTTLLSISDKIFTVDSSIGHLTACKKLQKKNTLIAFSKPSYKKVWFLPTGNRRAKLFSEV